MIGLQVGAILSYDTLSRIDFLQSDVLVALAAATARVSATEALERAARELIQIHGGIGVTWAHDCHLFYRRAQHLGVMLGALREWQDRLVAELGRKA